MSSAISVSELNTQIKGLLETTFTSVYVQGEISNLTYHNSGHIYFSIKDKDSTISCVMFRGNASRLKFRLELGAKIIISGALTVYTPRGNYQLLCNSIEPYGQGALALAYEQLRTKLQIKGYFNKAIKKPLPKYPNKIYVITSSTGAAIQDMKKILSHRYPLAKMILLPTIVQGENAKDEIVSNIKKADSLAKNEKDSIIIVGRGGGSIEDLWAFNEEIVANAIYEANTPIISAVGHENDFVISDEVADLRASTPSNAIEISTPNINDLRLLADTLYDDINNVYKNILNNKTNELNGLKNNFAQHSFESKFNFVQTNINQIKLNLNQMYKQIISNKQETINNIKNQIEYNNPKNKEKIGYAQISKNNKLIDINKLEVNDDFEIQSVNYKFNCKIIQKEKLS
jgi:exodeoxyribonuclease VII large subunit